VNDQRFPKSARLLTPSDFKQVMENAEVKSGQTNFLLLATATGKPSARLGFIVSKKRVKLAVERNRIKRCMRETFRHLQHELPPFDVVFLAKAHLADLNNHELQQSGKNALQHLCKRYQKLHASVKS